MSLNLDGMARPFKPYDPERGEEWEGANMADIITGECLHCGIQTEMEVFGYDDQGGPLIDINEQLCKPCRDRRLDGLAKAREYMSDLAPAWFDPANAGECWHEDDY